MAVFNNLTVKELYSTIPSVAAISQFMRTGLEQGSTQLAVSAMEELLLRKEQNEIHRNFIWALNKGCLKPGTSMSSLIARSLIESHDASSYTKIVGMGLLESNLEKMRETIAESFTACYGKIPKSGERATAEHLFSFYQGTGEIIFLPSGPEDIARAAKFFM